MKKLLLLLTILSLVSCKETVVEAVKNLDETGEDIISEYQGDEEVIEEEESESKENDKKDHEHLKKKKVIVVIIKNESDLEEMDEEDIEDIAESVIDEIDEDIEITDSEEESEIKEDIHKVKVESDVEQGVVLDKGDEEITLEEVTVISGINFERDKPMGLDISGAIVSKDQDIDEDDLFDYEIVFDENTVFEEREDFVADTLEEFQDDKESLQELRDNEMYKINSNNESIAKFQEKIDKGGPKGKIDAHTRKIESLREYNKEAEVKVQKIDAKLDYLNLVLTNFNLS